MKIPRGRLDTRLSIERYEPDLAFDGAGSENWKLVTKVMAEVQDILPSRAERQDGGFTVTTWRARVRMDRRSDITGAMRFVGRGRTMQIVSGPAQIDKPEGIEFIVEEYVPRRS